MGTRTENQQVRPSRVEYHRPWLYPKQEAAIFCRERYSVVEASTKSGKTIACMIWLAEQAMQGSGRNFWWIAPTNSVTKIAYRRMKRALPRQLYKPNDSEQTLTLANDNTLWFKTGDHPDTLYGEDVYAAVIDEASRCKEEAWWAIRSTLSATRGPIRIIGNVKGKKNWAYALARKAEAGEPGMHYARIVAADAVEAGVLDADEIRDAKGVLPANVYEELYEAKASDDTTNPFGESYIDACTRKTSGDLNALPPGYDSQGLSTRPPVVFGIDLAKKRDWLVVIGMDVQGAVCVFERWQASWEVSIPRIREIVGNTPGYVDSTGVGDVILERLIPGTGLEGFNFTEHSKQQLMEGLAVAIQQGDISFPDGPIVKELKAFEYVYTRTGVKYTAPSGVHDDCVDALALVTLRWVRMPKAFSAATGGDRVQGSRPSRGVTALQSYRDSVVRVPQRRRGTTNTGRRPIPIDIWRKIS